MLSQEEFLKKYNIDPQKYEETKLVWEDLEKVHEDYLLFRPELTNSATYIFNMLMTSPGVHSVRYRIKDPEHLVEKIIRKKIEDIESDITIDNYKHKVTDLIGLRALHLFKGGWKPIHDFIQNQWNLHGDIIAYYRKGDVEDVIDIYKKEGCVAKEHKYGYRSIHYIIKTQPGKTEYFAEVQVRTIFEEAWSEIDHTIRYPYDLDNQLYFEFLAILNRLAGSADEMGTYIQTLKTWREERDHQIEEQLRKNKEQQIENNQIVSDLKTEIEKLNLKVEQKEAMIANLEKLKVQQITTTVPTTTTTAIPPNYFQSPLADLGRVAKDFMPDMPNVKKIMDAAGMNNSNKIATMFNQQNSALKNTTTMAAGLSQNPYQKMQQDWLQSDGPFPKPNKDISGNDDEKLPDQEDKSSEDK